MTIVLSLWCSTSQALELCSKFSQKGMEYQSRMYHSYHCTSPDLRSGAFTSLCSWIHLELTFLIVIWYVNSSPLSGCLSFLSTYVIWLVSFFNHFNLAFFSHLLVKSKGNCRIFWSWFFHFFHCSFSVFIDKWDQNITQEQSLADDRNTLFWLWNVTFPCCLPWFHFG